MEKEEAVEAAPAAPAAGEAVPEVKHEIDEEQLEPYRYISVIPGKDVRGKLVDAFQVWLKIPPDKVEAVKEVVAMLHNASLLIDDIEDDSKLRRGVPAAHTIYGIPSTINTANYVYFLAMERVNKLACPTAQCCFLTELLNLHKGQGQDILWRDSNRCPTEDDYRVMVLNKTGGLFRLAVGLMQPFSPSDKRDYTDLLNKMALYFQIRDDLINLSGEEYMKSKSYCEDITEGKFSFPVIHCIRARPSDHRLINILKQRTMDIDVKQHAVQWMRQTGSFTYTRQVTEELRDAILAAIEALGGHSQLVELIVGLDQQLDRDMSGGAKLQAKGEELDQM